VYLNLKYSSKLVKQYTGWFKNNIWCIHIHNYFDTFGWHYCLIFLKSDYYDHKILFKLKNSEESNLCCRSKDAKSDIIRESPCITLRKYFHYYIVSGGSKRVNSLSIFYNLNSKLTFYFFKLKTLFCLVSLFYFILLGRCSITLSI
jgi:hypothetical protein